LSESRLVDFEPQGDIEMADVSGIVQLAVQHHQAGRLQQAEQLYNLALQSNPNHAFILHSLAMVAYQTGRYDAALTLAAEAVANNSQVPQFHNTLGLVLEALGRFDQAIEAYEQAVSLKPDYAEVYNNMGIALQAQGKYAAAAEKCRQALSLSPGYAQAYNTMGFSLQKQGKLAEAVESYRMAVRFAPNFAEAYNHMGVVLSALGRHEEAIESYGRAVQIEPDYAQAHWNRSLVLLLTGKLAEGWKDYQWRKHPDLGMMTYPHRHEVPQWDGSSFVGKRLLVHYEQGYGDAIQFVRYLPMVKARGGTVILEVGKPLIALLHHFPGVDELVEASRDLKPAVKFDLCVSLMDLPALFETTLDTIPADVPYIFADSTKAGYWRSKLAGPTFKVGIVWSGSPAYERNTIRSCRLEHFAPLAAIEGVKLFSLQKGTGTEQLEKPAGGISVVTDTANELRDFTDTAALIENLDLIVSVDTSVLHLAGAMGRPVWAILCAAPAWQWMLDRSDSPWYPTMTLFRQKELGRWDDVLRSAAEKLKELVIQKVGRR